MPGAGDTGEQREALQELTGLSPWDVVLHQMIPQHAGRGTQTSFRATAWNRSFYEASAGKQTAGVGEAGVIIRSSQMKDVTDGHAALPRALLLSLRRKGGHAEPARL